MLGSIERFLGLWRKILHRNGRGDSKGMFMRRDCCTAVVIVGRVGEFRVGDEKPMHGSGEEPKVSLC